jgi:hypothetical protein
MKYLIIFVALFSCSSKLPKDDSSILGIYTDFQPNIIDQLKIEHKLKGEIFPLPVSMIYLRADSTYVMGFCDIQVREAGRFSIVRDSLVLYDRFHLVKRERLPRQAMLYDFEDKILYFTRVDTASIYKKSPFRIIPLKKDWVYAHYGFLRGQEMSLDSLVNYYEQKSIEFQGVWSDSVKRSMR